MRIRAAAAAMRAAMEAGHADLEELAEALEDCCLLQSPESAAELYRLRRSAPGGASDAT